MRKVDRLLLKIREAQRIDELTLCHALVVPAPFAELGIAEGDPNYNKWVVQAYLNKSWGDSNGEMLEPLFYDTKAEAMKAAEEIEAVHAPTGGRVSTREAAYVTFDMSWGMDEDGAAEIERQAAEGQAALQKLADEADEAMRGTL